VILSAGQWFLAMLSAAGGLVLASLVWRLPAIQRLEEPEPPEERPPDQEEGFPEATHTPMTEEQPAPGAPSPNVGPGGV
jgi:hypothetical protein